MGRLIHSKRAIAMKMIKLKKLVREANKGNVLSQCILGNFYYRGIGVEQDYGEALQWYKTAAENGDSFSQFRLGIMYNAGSGVEADPVMAQHWLQKAARQGHDVARILLNLLYVGNPSCRSA